MDGGSFSDITNGHNIACPPGAGLPRRSARFLSRAKAGRAVARARFPRAKAGHMREIPSIEQLRRRPALRAIEAEMGSTLLVDALRAAAEALRERVAGGETPPADVAQALEH